MYYNNLNEAWFDSLTILQRGCSVVVRGLECKELINYNITIKHPFDRCVYCAAKPMNPFYMIGELLWYFSGSNKLDFISYYSKFWNKCSDDGATLNSAYGQRIFTNTHPQIPFNQFSHIVDVLQNDKHSRQAVLHFKTPSNTKTKDEVCTLSLQFLIRNDKLDCIATMRSNDICFGMPYDIYFFTFIQELLASKLKIELGMYHHNVGSFHIYKNKYHLFNNNNITYKTLQRGRSVEWDDFFEYIPRLLEFEQDIRLAINTTKAFYITLLQEFINKTPYSLMQEFAFILVLFKFKKLKIDAFEEYNKFIRYISTPFAQLLDLFFKHELNKNFITINEEG